MNARYWLVCAGLIISFVSGGYVGYRITLDTTVAEVQNVAEEGAYCNVPPPDCSNYTNSIEEWVEKYEELEDGWLQVQKDLARCQNYQNIDSMCTDGTCQ